MSADNFGVAGLGVMGRNVALNIERNGFPVVAYNRGDENAQRMRDESVGKNVTVTQSIEELVTLLDPPRRVLLMVTAGAGTDRVIDALLEHLGPGDVLIDGGNSHFPDTDRRAKRLQQAGLHFVGCGISGGEEGALWGPSIMPGGNFEAYERIAPVLEKIAAKTDDDGACVTYCGRHAAGHYVKMVHNGIEYGIMQLICEAYDILRRAAGMSTEQIQEVFQKWTASPKVGGFLVDITAQCLAKGDDHTGDPLVEKILDTAGQKGTGKWTAQTALDLGVPIPTLSQAVNARILSGLKQARLEASGVLTGPGHRMRARPRASRCYPAQRAAPCNGRVLRTRAAPDPDSIQGVRLWHRPCRGGPHLEGRLHHPLQAARPDQAGIQAGARDGETCCSIRRSPRSSTNPCRTCAKQSR